MSAPVMARRMTLEAPARLSDGAGGFTESWQTLGTIWAEVKPRGAGREVGDGAALKLKIVCRAVPQDAPSRPSAGMRFREGVRVFDIEAVTEADALGHFLVCFAKEETGA